MDCRLAVLCLAATITACSAGPRANPAIPETPDQDPPARVARISDLRGTVSFKAAGTNDWVSAVLNRPLTTGDSIWADRDARAEFTAGTLAIRLDAESGIDFLNLDDRIVQIRLVQGSVRVHLRAVEGDEEFEIDTASAAVTLVRPGDYRVFAGANSDAARVVVRAGVADVVSVGEPVSVRAGQQGAVAGRDAAVEVSAAPPLDAFDTYCEQRERRPAKSPTLEHVSRNVIGWEDLDNHGEWSEVPPYGPVWMPRVTVSGWAPYRFGHWVWIEPWGWTWVDDSPWGFAPFHYGRWVIWRTRWCWAPGPPRVRAVYAPALVVFVGGGRPGLRYHVSVGVGIGIGWFPLGPHEVYVPPYRHTRTYITNINISHTTIRNTAIIARTDASRQSYVHRRSPGAITSVSEDVFLSGRGIGRAAAPMSERDAARARVGGTAAPVAPSRKSVTGDPGTRAPRPPEAAARRTPVVRRNPAPRPPDFERRQPELQRNPGVPLDPRKTEEIRRQQPAERQPEYRRAPESGRRAEPRTAEPRQTEPKRAEPKRAEPRERTRAESGKQTENRRREIDREHSRTR